MISMSVAIGFGIYLCVALYFSMKSAHKTGYVQGLQDILTSVEEALDHDRSKIDSLYEKMAKNKGMRVEISEEI